MKLSVLVLAVCSTLIATASFAAEKQTILHNVLIDGVQENHHVAIVGIDDAKKVISVDIVNDICGAYSPTIGFKCMAMPAPVASVELPYKTRTSAGSVYYRAKKDYRPVDGALYELTYVDHSLRTAEDVQLDKPILTLKIESLRGSKHEYTAYQLPAMPVQPKLEGDEAIYEALNVPAVEVNPGIAGSSRLRKSVGGLVCEKSLTVVPGAVAHYDCSLTK